jgi:glycosyltransferase involved in cell wall biosynthesis
VGHLAHTIEVTNHSVVTLLAQLHEASARADDERSHRDELAALRHVELLDRTQAVERQLVAAIDGLRAESIAAIAGLRAESVGELHALAVEFRRRSDDLHVTTRLVGDSVTSVAEHLAAVDSGGATDGPLVSVIVPVRNRAGLLARCLTSVVAQTYPNWECVVVDDGSHDDVVAAVERATGGDERFRVVRREHGGAAAARAAGIEATTGELVTFLDSDNEWYPNRLARIVAAFAARPDASWAIDQQVVDGIPDGTARVRAMRADLSALEDENFIDAGSVTMTRLALERAGGVDTSRHRLDDWDLVLRLGGLGEPIRVPTIGNHYIDRSDDRLSVASSAGPERHRIRRGRRGLPAAGLRILAAEWHYPQGTESYIENDLAGLRELGAEITVWSELDEAALVYESPHQVLHGDLADAVSEVQPSLVLTHWISTARRLRPVTAAAGVPHVVRAHGFDHDNDVVAELVAHRHTLVHLHPHQFGPWAHHPAVSAHPVSFDHGRYQPVNDSDNRHVVRIAAGLTTKDLETFVETAKRCPDHRFTLAIGTALYREHVIDELASYVRSSGAAIELRRDLSPTEASTLVSEAGIYLHTHGTSTPFGMPVSIVESLATGSYVLARDLPGIHGLLGPAGDLYDGASVEARADHAAAFINATLAWDDRRWAAQHTRALDRAWRLFPADVVAADLVATWRERLPLHA